MTAPRRYRGLLIGNASFPRDPHGLPSLHGPAVDLKEFRRALTDERTGLFSPDDIGELLDRGVQELREALHEFFIESAERDDVLLLYYSGHGKLDLLSNLHLCARDSKTGSLPVTALRYKQDIESLIDETPATTTITILDCCYSGAFRGGDFFVDAAGRGKCVISSARANELALDSLGEGSPSPFTGALVQGLMLAEAEAEGRLTTRRLYDHIGVLLGKAGNARPQFHFDGEGEIVIAGRAGGHTEAPPRPEGGPKRSNATRPTLPEARNGRESILNEAMKAAFEAPEDHARLGAVREVVRAAVDTDAEWAERTLLMLPYGDIREAAMSGLFSRLPEVDAPRAMLLIGKLSDADPGKVEQLTALAEAVAADGEGNPAGHLLSEAMRCAPLIPEDAPNAAEVLARLAAIVESAGDPELSERVVRAADEASRERKAAVLAAARSMPGPPAWDRPAVLARIASRIDAAASPSDRWRMLVSVVGELGVAAPGVASELLNRADRIVPGLHAEQGGIGPAIESAASIIDSSPDVARRLLGLVERLVDSLPPGEEKLRLLVEAVKGLAAKDPGLTERFLLELERTVARSPEDESWLLEFTAEELSAASPETAERLVHLIVDDDRRFRALVSVAREMRSTAPRIARRLVDEAERLARSKHTDDDRFHAMLRLAEAYAAVDPDCAPRFLRSLPLQGSALAVAYQRAGKVLAETAPDRVQAFVDDLGRNVDESLLLDMAEGVAQVDPEGALALVGRLPSDSSGKELVWVAAVKALSGSDPARAEAVAESIRSADRRAKAFEALVKALAEHDPHHAARLARSMPDYEGSADDKVSALVAAAAALHRSDVRSAERLLDMAERHAFSVGDQRMHKAGALAEAARGFAAFDRGRAERLLVAAERFAHELKDEHTDYRSSILADIMIVWADVAPGQAERLARTIPDSWIYKDMYVERTAEVLARTGSTQVVRFVEMIADKNKRLWATRKLVRSMAVTAPGRAERLANQLPAGRERASALVELVSEAHSAGML